MEIKCNIKAILATKEMTARELAAAIGVTETTVSNWTNNTSYPTLVKLFTIADALDVTIDQLYSKK